MTLVRDALQKAGGSAPNSPSSPSRVHARSRSGGAAEAPPHDVSEVTAAFTAFASSLLATLEADGQEAVEVLMDGRQQLAEVGAEEARAALDERVLGGFVGVATHASDAVEVLREATHEAARRQLRAQAATYEMKLATVRTASDVQIHNQKVELEAHHQRVLTEQIAALASGDSSLLLAVTAGWRAMEPGLRLIGGPDCA